MKVFISWSMERSQKVSEAIREWLPLILNGPLDLFVSSKDIAPGQRWQHIIKGQLEANYALACVTRENQREPWLNFEAGAIGKNAESRVMVIALDLAKGEVENPLGQFQSVEWNKDEMLLVLTALNKLSDSPKEDEVLRELFDTFWPKIDAIVKTILDRREETTPVRRTAESMLEELLETVRATARSSVNVVGTFPVRPSIYGSPFVNWTPGLPGATAGPAAAVGVSGAAGAIGPTGTAPSVRVLTSQDQSSVVDEIRGFLESLKVPLTLGWNEGDNVVKIYGDIERLPDGMTAAIRGRGVSVGLWVEFLQEPAGAT